MKRLLKVPFIGLLVTVLMVACGGKESAQELLKDAETFEQQGKHDEAIHALEKLVRDYPDNDTADKALHRAAFLYYNNKSDFHKSIEYHRKLVDKYPESKYTPQARFMVGFIYANDLKDYASAETAYKTFLEYHADHELGESVKWELQHLGEDVNEQMRDLFGDGEDKGSTDG